MNAATQLLPAPMWSPADGGDGADDPTAAPSARPCVAPPPPWRPTGIIRDALVRLKVRCDGDRHETAWRCGLLQAQQWGFPSEAFMYAWQNLAIALSSGDDAAANAAAGIIVATRRTDGGGL